MKKQILLLDDSLTVQKVVALTLDKTRYEMTYAKNRSDFMKAIMDKGYELILVSDQVPEITASSFPKEVESWLNRNHKVPSFILITGHDVKEMRHYQAVLKKPFSPQLLQNLVAEHTRHDDSDNSPRAMNEEGDDNRLQTMFNDTFNDEGSLVRETFEADLDKDEPTLLAISPLHAVGKTYSRPETDTSLWQERASRNSALSDSGLASLRNDSEPANLWSKESENKSKPMSELLSSEDSVAYKAVLRQQVESKLGASDLNEMVEKILRRMLPPIVEKLVQERLDKLLKEHEQFMELKP